MRSHAASAAAEGDAWPSVSVIIVTKGHHRLAAGAVRSVLAADYPAGRREIIVVEETDRPQAIEGEGVRYVAIPLRHLGLGYARNQGLAHAAAEVLVFTDDDCTVERTWLKELVRPLLRSREVAGVAGAVLVPSCGAVGQCENILGFPGGGVKFIEQARGRVVPRPTFSTCNCAVRRWAVEEVGGFRENMRSSGEDELLSRQISARHLLLYNPAALVRHAPRDSFAGVFGWLWRRGLARAEMYRNVERKGRFLLRVGAQSPFVRLALLSGLALLGSLPLPLTLPAAALVYYLATVGRYRWARKYYPAPRTILLLPLVKTTMDIAMDLGTAQGLLGRRERG